MWEDEKNRHGGRWLINLDKKQRMTSLDNFWLEVMLCLIGESFEDHSQVVSAISNSIQGRKGGQILHLQGHDQIPPLQSMMVVKLREQRLWPCHLSGLDVARIRQCRRYPYHTSQVEPVLMSSLDNF